MNLYIIQQKYFQLMELIEDNDGEINEIVAKQLEKLEDDKENLLNGLCSLVKQDEYNVQIIKEEIERLEGKQSECESKIDNTKKNIIKILKHFNMHNPNKKFSNFVFKSALFSASTKEMPIIEFDETQLPKFAPITGIKSKYIRYTVSTKFDSENIMKLNKEFNIPLPDYKTIIDKDKAKEYIKSLDTKQPALFEEVVEEDPIKDIARQFKKESITIK